MSGIADIDVAGLSDQDLRDFASALTVRQARVLMASMEFVDIAGIAAMLGLSYNRIKTMRRKADEVENGQRPDELPEAMALPGNSPIYLRREIVTWARQTGRLDAAGNPIRLRSVGRPPRGGRKRDDTGRFTT